ncbi:dynein axonemal intermediate chain 2 isoform X2 [Cylas formicarius]|uniref:dynein axonemal intermediate chain 2 isoform X2 n=1 Tax=Cylas formicarius TaxID=197179 RepID=UPI0029584A57|nr:dynein axonemal intermediate chain 2 isoform X2 [Cylas formicarius]
MDITYGYQKKRSEFGRQCLFSDKGPDLIDHYPSNKKLTKEYILRDPVHRSTQWAPVQSEHHLNTMRAEYSSSSMNHFEGGWPKDINTADEEQTKRYRRKIEKDENFSHTMMQLFKSMENCILQNNAINIYQQYFSDVEATPLVERSTARTVNVYLDQSAPSRPINHISWSPDGKEATFSYIWEVENPNRPLLTLKPEHPIVCLEYNPKDPHSLVSGQINGQVAVWDTRKGYEPVELSLIENSFRDPVRDVLWINSKSGTEFFSSSTDGQIKWWDTRKLSEATETLILDYRKDDEQSLTNALGASCLEYETTIPTRFMVGTEQGVVVSCNRKGKTAMEKMPVRFNAHMGPVVALQRNPAFVKNFLTVGDWSAKIWSEDCRESAIIWTGFHRATLTDGVWSPTRLSVFFTTRTDGILDVWDVLQQQKRACLGVKVCDEPLKCLRAHEMGRLVAVGNQRGTTYLVEFSENLAVSNKNDKLLLTAMFERESRREKILEARGRELRLKQKTKQPQQTDVLDEEQTDENMEAVAEVVFGDSLVRHAESDFYETFEREKKAAEPPEEKEIYDENAVEVKNEETETDATPPNPKETKRK